VLSAATMSRITDEQRSTLLAASVTLAAVGERAPDDAWPWKRERSLWVLRYDPLGPRQELVNDAAFAPTFAWPAGWPAAIRGGVVAAGVLVALVAMALGLWLRTKAAVIGIVVWSLVSSGAVMVWLRSLGAVSIAGGDVVVAGNELVQRDAWVYERARTSAQPTVVWAGWTRPVFASEQQLEPANLRVNVDAAGHTSFQYAAERGQTVAFVHRQVGPSYRLPARADRSSPMTELARQLYLVPGASLVGQELSAGGGRWPGSIVMRAAQP